MASLPRHLLLRLRHRLNWRLIRLGLFAVVGLFIVVSVISGGGLFPPNTHVVSFGGSAKERDLDTDNVPKVIKEFEAEFIEGAGEYGKVKNILFKQTV